MEINYTFRHMPSEKTLTVVGRRPRRPASPFAVKAHQAITHRNRLKEGAREPLEYFLGTLAPLRDAGRLGPVLLQLPPNLKLDLERLERFLELLPRDLRFAFEFREASWFREEVYALLRAHDASLCVAEAEELTVPDVVTADFAYYRMRKPPYDEAALARLRRRADELTGGGRDVYVALQARGGGGRRARGGAAARRLSAPAR